jgi:hypothetical protein
MIDGRVIATNLTRTKLPNFILVSDIIMPGFKRFMSISQELGDLVILGTENITICLFFFCEESILTSNPL